MFVKITFFKKIEKLKGNQKVISNNIGREIYLKEMEV